MDWIESVPIAHRGLHGDGAPENSVDAVERAIEAGYAIEIDVRLSSDGVPVVFHDEDLERLTGRSASVHELEYKHLDELRLEDTPNRIPRLETVLEVVDGRVPVLVELKNWEMPGPLEQSVHDKLRGYDGPFAVQSFNPRSMAWFRRHEPDWLRGQVASTFEGVQLQAAQKFLLKRLLVTPISQPDFVAYEHSVLPYWPVTMHRQLGLPILAWTVRSPEEHERVQEHVDNVIFEGYHP